MNAAFLEALDDREQLLQRAPEPVEAKDVAGPRLINQLSQSRSLGACARSAVREDADGAGVGEPVLLAGRVLVARRDARTKTALLAQGETIAPVQAAALANRLPVPPRPRPWP